MSRVGRRYFATHTYLTLEEKTRITRRYFARCERCQWEGRKYRSQAPAYAAIRRHDEAKHGKVGA